MQAVNLLSATNIDVSILGPTRRICWQGCSADFAAQVQVAESQAAGGAAPLQNIAGAQGSFPITNPDVTYNLNVTAGSIGTGKVWVEGVAGQCGAIALTTAAQDISFTNPPRRVAMRGAGASYVADIQSVDAHGETNTLGRIYGPNGSIELPNDPSVQLKRVDVAGALGAGAIWVSGQLADQYQEQPQNTFRARGVVTANIADLTNFTVNAAPNDGITYQQDDIVLLAAQTTSPQNGPYIVGPVAGGVAPLVRPSWYAVGETLKTAMKIDLGPEGTVYKNTTWRSMRAADTFVADTDDPEFFPEKVTFSTALVAGVVTAGAGATVGAPTTAFIFSTGTMLIITRKTPNTTAATVMYVQNGNATPGVGAAGAISGMAAVAAGTVNNADVSTMECTYINQA